MMNDKNGASGSAGGIGFAGLLTIAFIVLKLLGVITWRWVWVLSPIWITAVIAVLLVIVIIVFAIAKGR